MYNCRVVGDIIELSLWQNSITTHYKFFLRSFDQVTHVMKMEKESAEKSMDLKNMEEMDLSERHKKILANMGRLTCI